MDRKTEGDTKTKGGKNFKNKPWSIVLNATEPYKHLFRDKELLGQLITQGAKKYFSCKCPLDLANRRLLAIFVNQFQGNDGVWLTISGITGRV